MFTPLVLTALCSPFFATPDPAHPAPPVRDESSSIEWHNGTFFSALGAAGESEKNILIYFWANESEQCSRLYGETMSQEPVIEKMGDFLCYSANTGDAAAYKLVEKFNISTLPTLLVVTPHSEIEDAITGYIDGGGLTQELARVLRGEATVSDFRRKAEAAPEDVEVQYAYSVKLRDCGAIETADEIDANLRALDPKGMTPVVSRMLMSDVIDSILEPNKKDDGSIDWMAVDLAPLHEFLADAQHADTLYRGWSWVAYVDTESERHAESRAAYMAAYPHCGDDDALGFCKKVSQHFFETRETELSKDEAKFALRAAERAHEEALAWLEVAKKREGRFEGMSDADLDGMVNGMQAEYLDVLAGAYYLNGKAKKAIELEERCHELAPDGYWATRIELFKSRG